MDQKDAGPSGIDPFGPPPDRNAIEGAAYSRRGVGRQGRGGGRSGIKLRVLRNFSCCITQYAYIVPVKIVRTTIFTKCLKKLNASESDIERLESELASNPSAGDVIQGLSGARKVRFAMGGKGKRGGGRAIYVVA